MESWRSWWISKRVLDVSGISPVSCNIRGGGGGTYYSNAGGNGGGPKFCPIYVSMDTVQIDII